LAEILATDPRRSIKQPFQASVYFDGVVLAAIQKLDAIFGMADRGPSGPLSFRQRQG
jgi:hypothetical protein